MSAFSIRCRECGARLPASTPESLCPLCCEEDETEGEIRLLGDCEIHGELGRGGMGVVWRGRQRALRREVAVKTLPGGSLAGPEARARFKTEALAAARLQHPGIVTVYEVGEDDGLPYLVMELIHGRTLASVLEGKPAVSTTAARWLQQVALAVEHAHAHGVLHRDLKPSNILIEEGSGRPRVMDFGLARLTDENSNLTLTGAAMGSPALMPSNHPPAGALAFAWPDPSGTVRLLAVATGNSRIALITLPKCELASVLTAPAELAMHRLAFSPDGQWLAATTARGEVQLWKLSEIAGVP